jgi:hypothetical protein
MFNRSHLAIALTVPMLFACKPRTYNANTKSLVPMTVSSATEYSGFRLGYAESIGLKSYKVVRELVSSDTSVSEDRRSVVRIKLGKVTEEQYKLLMDHYGGQGFVPYNSAREYELQDFLPPKVQALLYRWLVPTYEVDSRIPIAWGSPYHPDEPVSTGVSMNCWTTAYEVVRDWSKPWNDTQGKLAYFGSKIAENMLWTNKTAIVKNDLLDRSAWAPEKVSERNAGRQPGDVLYIKTQYSYFGPAHAAVWIDDDLYFEKTNSSSDDPIRLAHYSDVINAYLQQDDAERPMTMNFLRYKPGSLPAQDSFTGKDPFGRDGLPPLPAEVAKNTIFTLDQGTGGNLKEFSANRIVTFPIGRDEKTGRAIYVGASDVKNFQTSDKLCTGKGEKFSYKLTTEMVLHVFDAQEREIAKVGGKRVAKNPAGGVVAEFPSGDKKLTLSSQGAGMTTYILAHPGVSDRIELECTRSGTL